MIDENRRKPVVVINLSPQWYVYDTLMVDCGVNNLKWSPQIITMVAKKLHSSLSNSQIVLVSPQFRVIHGWIILAYLAIKLKQGIYIFVTTIARAAFQLKVIRRQLYFVLLLLFINVFSSSNNNKFFSLAVVMLIYVTMPRYLSIKNLYSFIIYCLQTCLMCLHVFSCLVFEGKPQLLHSTEFSY